MILRRLARPFQSTLINLNAPGFRGAQRLSAIEAPQRGCGSNERS